MVQPRYTNGAGQGGQSLRARTPDRNQAFTRKDLVVLIATVGLLAVLFMYFQAYPARKAKRDRMQCLSNLQQIGLAFRIFGGSGDKFPMQTDAYSGGSIEAGATGETFRHFVVCSNELNTPKILVCPSDTRTAATDFLRLANSNLSYFVGLEGNEEIPRMLLSGDRNLTNGLPTKKGVLEVSAGHPAGWTREMHVEQGNIGLCDGSAQSIDTPSIRRLIEAHQVDGKPVPQKLQFPE
jgi:hypothetical protein